MQKGHASLVLLVVLLARALHAQAATPQASELRDDSRVTPVASESWLIHLNRSFGDTSMGKTGRLGPGPEESGAIRPQAQAPIFSSPNRVTLHGSDLYRLNCQGCHGESGLGAPPEINSVINPVRATSVPLVLMRMKKAGMDISSADATKLAQQSKSALLDRLHKGGENMPPFSHLDQTEVRILLAYLKQLADVPGTGDQSVVRESHVRVGELIVKSTCHTCHSAVGPDPGPADLMEGAIPPLSTLTARENQSDFIRKVTQGAPVLMGTPPALCRGRMPVFFYLSEEEAADVYLYLMLYPPSKHSTDNLLVAASQLVKPPSAGGSGSPQPALVLKNVTPEDADSTKTAGLPVAALSLVIALVTSMLAGGLYFTFREFRRLSAERDCRGAIARDLRVELAISGPMKPIHRTAQPLLYSGVKRSSQ